jgi:putative spermidine/putrescine transport system substrate-binding protein
MDRDERYGFGKRVTRREALRTVGAAAVVVAAASALTLPAGAAPLQATPEQHPATQDVNYDGSVFDAGGAVLNLGDWPGFWQDMQHQNLIDQFQKDFNCTVNYDGSWPWSPKFAAGGPQNPPLDVANWNLPDLFKTARGGDYFVPIDELKANVPNSADLWPFAYENGLGITYLFSQYGYAYRKDLVDPPPTKFADFWDSRFSGKRATYISVNTLQMVFFMVASKVFGGDVQNVDAGYDAMQKAMPMKISDFTGNMQTLLERGEAVIVVQHDGEPYAQIDKGVPVGWMYWTELQPVLDQTKTVSRWSQPMQKKLGYALIQRSTDPSYQEAIGVQLYERPTNSKAKIVDNLASKGVVNTPEAAKLLWTPPWDWFVDHQDEINERVDKIFGA